MPKYKVTIPYPCFVTVVVDAERVDEIFEFIFFQGELNKPGGGFIYQTSLIKASHYTLPSIEG